MSVLTPIPQPLAPCSSCTPPFPKGLTSADRYFSFSSYRSTPAPCYKDCTLNPPIPSPHIHAEMSSARKVPSPTPFIPPDTHTYTKSRKHLSNLTSPPIFQNQRTCNNPLKMGRDGIQRPPHQRRFIHEYSTLRH